MQFQFLKVETQSEFAEFALPLDTIKRNLEEKKYLLCDITWCIRAYLIHHMN